MFTKKEGSTIEDMSNWVEKEYGVDLDMIALGTKQLYMVRNKNDNSIMMNDE